jgi:hypothetical protein
MYSKFPRLEEIEECIEVNYKSYASMHSFVKSICTTTNHGFLKGSN